MIMNSAMVPTEHVCIHDTVDKVVEAVKLAEHNTISREIKASIR